MFLMMFAWQPPHFYALAIKRSDEYSLAGVPMLPSVKGNVRTQKSIVMWIAILALTPLLMFELGIWFVVLTTILNIVWLYIALNVTRTLLFLEVLSCPSSPLCKSHGKGHCVRPKSGKRKFDLGDTQWQLVEACGRYTTDEPSPSHNPSAFRMANLYFAQRWGRFQELG